MQFEIRDSRPIWQQLAQQLRERIVKGEYPPGSHFPTVRELAAQAGVNPNTMQRAMQQLEREGLVYAQRSNGRFVTEDAAVIDKAREKLAGEHVRRYRAEMKSLGFSEREMISLLEGSGEEDDNGLLS